MLNKFAVLWTFANLLWCTPDSNAASGLQNRPAALNDCENCPQMIAVKKPMGDRLFYMAQLEVTWKDYWQAIAENGCPLAAAPTWPNKSYSISGLKPNSPVPLDNAIYSSAFPLTGIKDAHVDCYLSWLKNKTGKAYRLPTEAEWRFSAYSGTKSKYPWGEKRKLSALPGEKLERPFQKNPIQDPFFATIEVGKFAANANGLLDVVGNVEELTADLEHAPRGSKMTIIEREYSARVVCGGSIAHDIIWDERRSPCYQLIYKASIPYSDHTGFRVVRDQ